MSCLLLEVINTPERMKALSPSEWDVLIPQARTASMLAALYLCAEDAGLQEYLPPRPGTHLFSSWVVHEKQRRSLEYELKWLLRAFAEAGERLVLLKGAAYILADLPAASGRLISDIDLLVPQARIDTVEQVLGEFGWKSGDMDPYDERYYRKWGHEIPPMGHQSRGSTLDVHHTILRPTARPEPDVEKLFGAVREVRPGVYVLSPADMVIHSATHLFHEGEFHRGLRDLLDLDRLLRHFGENEPEFWQQLPGRAQELDLIESLYYALHYVRHFYATPIPESVLQAADAGKPGSLMSSVMDFLFMRALMPDHPSCNRRFTGLARFCLYVRSHHLRMPMWQLLPHLVRKAWMKRVKVKSEDDDV